MANNTTLRYLFHLSASFPLDYAVIVNGYVYDVFIVLTLVANIAVMLVLLQKHMRSPSNLLLAAMALSDLLTGLFSFPVYFYFFTLKHCYDFVEYKWCYIYRVFGIILPTICHTASIWLTVALAVLRYIYICHSTQSRNLCTVRNVKITAVVIYIVAILSQASLFVDTVYEEYPVQSILDLNKTISACVTYSPPWVDKHADQYYMTVAGFRVIFIHFIPCMLLLILNGLLIKTMRQAQLRRKRLLQENKRSESKKIKDSNCTTLMMVTVVGLFLLVELPLGVLLILYSLHNFQIIQLAENNFNLLIMFSNMCILISYPLNFLIYCGMSRQFRETFKRMFTGKPMPMRRECSHYTQVPTQNGVEDNTAM